MDKFPASNPFGRMLGGSSSLLTYEPYYGLREKPFSLSTDPRFLYRSAEHARTFDDLLLAIRRREGLVVLTGDIGTGKTTLCKAVLEKLDRKTFTTFVPDPFITREDLLKRMLIEFGVMSVEDLKGGRMTGASHSDLSYPLYDFLKTLVPLQAFAVLIIDETQNLSLPLLEEIRILSDLESPEKLLQVVLVGQLELRSKLKLPEMRQLDQRVSARCSLQALTREAVSGYIWHRLSVAGGTEDRVQFSSSAIDAVFRASGGVPRLINLVCDRALHLAYLKHKNVIDPEEVAQAVEELGVGNLTAAPVLEEAARATAPVHRPMPAAIGPATVSAQPLTIAPPRQASSAQSPAPIVPPPVVTPQPQTVFERPAAFTAPAVVASPPPASNAQPQTIAVPPAVTSQEPLPLAAPPPISEPLLSELSTRRRITPERPLAAAVRLPETVAKPPLAQPQPPPAPARRPTTINTGVLTGLEPDLSGLDVHDIPNDLHSPLALSVPNEPGTPYMPVLTLRANSNRALLDESAAARKWRGRAFRVAIGVSILMTLMAFVVLGELMIMHYYPDPAYQVLEWPASPPAPQMSRPAAPVEVPPNLLAPPPPATGTLAPRVPPKIE